MVMTLRKGDDGRHAAFRRPLLAWVKPQWRFDPAERTFKTRRGRTTFSPWEGLPSGTEIEYSVPRLAAIPPSRISKTERRLARLLRVVLPPGHQPDDFLALVRSWPAVADVEVGPGGEPPGPPPPSLLP